MPAHYVCLSDMHLGYEKSVLNIPPPRIIS